MKYIFKKHLGLMIIFTAVPFQMGCVEPRFDKKRAFVKINDCWTPAVPNSNQTLVVKPDGTGSILAQNNANSSIECEPLR